MGIMNEHELTQQDYAVILTALKKVALPMEVTLPVYNKVQTLAQAALTVPQQAKGKKK